MVREGYIQTDVGVFPKDWEVASLGDIGDPKMCKRVLKEQTKPQGDIPFFKIGTFGGEPDAFISRELFESFRCRFSYPNIGDILLSAAGTIGRTVIFDGKDAYFQDSNIVWIDNNEKKIYNKYLYYVYHATKWKTADGGTVSRLYNDLLKKTVIVIPPLPEQEAIASALSDVDELITNLEKLIEKKKNIKHGVMQELLTGKRRLPGFVGEWIQVNMAKNSKIKARIGWQGLTTAEYLDEGYSYLVTGTDFRDGRIDWNGCHFVTRDRYDQDTNIQIKNGDVLITKDGTIGKIAMVDGLTQPATLNSGVFVVRPITEAFTPQYLYFVLMSEIFKKFIAELMAGSTITHLYQKDIVKFNFPVPPTQEEQNAISSVIFDMDIEISILQSKLQKYRQLKQGMMQKLLTGEIRLV